LRAGSFYGSTGPSIESVELSDNEVTVRCSPAASVTLVTGRRRGSRANAGRLGYPNDSEILERDSAGLITACRLAKQWNTPYGRLELADPFGRKAWTNALWIG
jgi:hypothetical protein